MPVQLDHFIVPSRDAPVAAKCLADVLGVTWEKAATIGPFSPVYVTGGLTLDFQTTAEAFPISHYCFRVNSTEFDAIVARLEAAGIRYRSTVEGPDDMKVGPYTNIYWNVPDGHYWEVLVTSYARKA